MKRWHLSGILAAAGLAAFSAWAAGKPADMRDLMTVNQFRSAGLAGLSDAQMKSLNADVMNISVDAAAHNAVDLENILTAQEFHADGLDTLTPEQRGALNDWITGYLHSESQAEAAAAPPAQRTSAPAAATRDAAFGASMLKSNTDEPNNIHSSIVGKFTGWSGRTIFTLANGQVWQQSEPADYDTTMMNPEVVIKKLSFGYLLTIPGRGQTVFVARIK